MEDRRDAAWACTDRAIGMPPARPRRRRPRRYVVLNVTSPPLLVPAEFVAEIRKWYSVFATRPAPIDADTAIGLVPDPGSDLHGAFDP
jgi:hypothetical protein